MFWNSCSHSEKRLTWPLPGFKHQTKELKRKGAIVDTAGAIENTLKIAEESASTVKDIATDAGRVSPHTTKAIHKGVDLVKKETNHVTGMVVKDLKTKVGVR